MCDPRFLTVFIGTIAGLLTRDSLLLRLPSLVIHFSSFHQFLRRRIFMRYRDHQKFLHIDNSFVVPSLSGRRKPAPLLAFQPVHLNRNLIAQLLLTHGTYFRN